MQTFTGLQYLQIDIANHFGLNKLKWLDRIFWVRNNDAVLEKLDVKAKEPFQYRKAVKAYRRVKLGLPTDHLINLDATASGIQIMAAMSGCLKSAHTVNLVDTGQRESVYQLMADKMNEILKTNYFTEKLLKKPVMTFFYGSTAKPKEIFGEEGPALEAFYRTLEELLPGPYTLREIFLKSWDPSAYHYGWAMPDGHYCHVPVMIKDEKGLEIDEANHLRFTMRVSRCAPKDFGLALAANIVHSVDAWVARMMVKRGKAQGFPVIPIHDCFFTTPNNGNNLRFLYREVMRDVADMNLVTSILSQLYQRDFPYSKISKDLGEFIMKSEYALS